MNFLDSLHRIVCNMFLKQSYSSWIRLFFIKISETESTECAIIYPVIILSLVFSGVYPTEINNKKGGGFIDPTGFVLKGRYCIIDKIGQGGEGSMYLARDLELGVLRAVKELPLANKREAKLLRLLDHQALPKMMDYTERGEYCYLVMEYIRGRSLGEVLREGRQFSLKEIIFTGKKILDILEYLHSRKPAVCYGDLKPDNLMLTENGNLYLVDFGSAQTEYEYGRVSCKGTPGFAAPEQLKGQAQKASDFYGLGKTMETLCGKHKWKYFLLFPDFGYFIYRCCAADPARRWQDTWKAREELEKIRPLKIKLKAMLLPAATVLMILVLWVSFGQQIEKNYPPLEHVVAFATTPFYSPDYRTGNKERQKIIVKNIEQSLQGMQKIYKEQEEQIQILRLLIVCGELQGAEKAEDYYRQLLAYEPQFGQGYISYGNFLLRQLRKEESREIYAQWKKNTAQKNVDNAEINREELKLWEKELEK